LRFQFRFQRWADVLEWFAREADLSLVLDAPPPGTFNYSDTREYTPSEAIDLLNGVLQTKGYTLIRRGRMLLVINLKGGLPEGVVPQITLDDVDKRGKFELVTVRFPTGGRLMSTVVTEITPLLGPYGKVVPLPASAQVQVTDSAGILQSVKAQIQSIAEATTTPTGASEVLAHYPVRPADPQAALTTFKVLFPLVKMAYDETGDKLHVVATPAEQIMVQKLIEDMRTGNPAEKQARLELYTVGEGLAPQALTVLKTILPKAILTLDPKTSKIAAWGLAADHEIIKQTIAKMGDETAAGHGATLEVYRLAGADATTLLLLQSTLPEAKLSLDPTSGDLLAWATPAEHKRLAASLAKLGTAPGRETAPQVEVFKLTKASPTVTLTVLQTLLPHAKVSLDAASNSIVAVANADDRKVIKETIDRMQAANAGANAPELSFHVFKQPPPADLVTVLRTAVPLATLKLDTEGKRLTIVATAEDRTFLESLLARYEKIAPAEEKNQLAIYAVTPEQKTRLQAVMTTLTTDLPGIKVVADADPNQVAVWAKPEQQEILRGILEQLRKDLPPEQQSHLVVYPVDVENATPLLTFLQLLAPTAKMAVDADAHSVAVWGTKKEHETIREAVSKFGGAGSLETAKQVEVYPLTKADPTATLALLKTLIPKARLALDSHTQRLIVVATLSDQNVVRGTLEQLQPEKPGPTDPELRSYSLKKPAPATLATGLQALAPAAQVTLDTVGQRLMVVAPPAEQELIKTNIERFEQAADAQGPERLIIYQLKTADPTTVVTTLAKMFPRAEWTPDKKGRRIVVLARVEDHEAIRAAIEQLNNGQHGDDSAQSLMVYPVQADPKTVADMLQEIFPDMQFTADPKTQGIIARGSPLEQRTVTGIIQGMNQSDASLRPKLATYPTGRVDPTTLRTLLTQLVPNATVTADLRSRTVLALATPKEHEAIRAAVEKLSEAESPDTAPVTASYILRATGAAAAIRLLTAALPEAQLTVGGDPSQLIAFARPSEQVIIKSAIEQMESQGVLDDKRVMAVYSLPAKDAAALTLALDPTTLKNAKVTPLPNRDGLLVWAEPAQQKAIKKSIEEFKKELPKALESTAKVYHFRWADPRTAVAALTALLPTARLTADYVARTLIATALPDEHKQIAAMVEEIDKEDPATAAKLATYPTGRVDPTTLRTLLTQLVPNATVTADLRSRTVLALATPKEHEAIRAAVEKLSEAEAPDTAPVTASYILRATGAAAAIRLLTAALPEAQFTVGSDPSQLIAFARPSEQAIIKSAVEQMESQGVLDDKRVMAVYSLPAKDAAALTLALDPTTLKNAKITPLPNRDGLLVWAEPAQQKAIKKSVEEFKKELPKALEATTKVYHFRWADPRSAATALTALLPTARLTADFTARTLIATAMPDEHKQIAAAVEEIDKEDPATAAKLATYSAGRVDPTTLRTLLIQLVPNATVTADLRSRTVLALATPKEHEAIRGAVEKLSEAEAPDTAPVTASYVVRVTGAAAASRLLTAALPEAQFGVGSDPSQLIAFARPSEQAIIKAAVEQMESQGLLDDKRVMAVYSLPAKDAAALTLALDPTTLKNAKITPFPNRDGLMVWAEPAQQKAIKKSIEEFKKELPKALESTAKVYHFRWADPRSAATALTALLPDARLTADVTARTLIASALPQDQEKIATAVKEIDQEDPATAAKLVTYPAGRVDPTALRTLLTQLVPNAAVTADVRSRTVLALATPKEHEAIRGAVEKLSEAESPETAPVTASYVLRVTGAAAASRLFTAAFPEAQFAVGSDPSQLIAFARPSEQAIIKAAVEQMETEGLLDDKRVMAVYSLPMKDAAALTEALDLTTLKNARITPFPNRDGLMVWAEPAQQKAIKKSIEEFKKELPKAMEATAKVYRFRRGDAKAALTALTALLPHAKLAADTNGRALVASALPEDHEKIAAAVAELDREDAATDAKLRVHRIVSADSQNLLLVLQGLFKTRPEVQISLDPQHDAIVAVATPEEHETISTLIQQVEKGLPGEVGATLEIYSLEDIEGTGIVVALSKLLEKHGGKAELSIDPYSKQLVALAKPEQHRMIRTTLEGLRGGERSLDILQLETLELSTAERAIHQLFAGDSLHGPDVESDSATDQIFIRGTPEQIKKVRELLVKMGETGLKEPGAATGGPMRTISFHGDAKSAIEEIQRLWPQLRQNELRVVTPSAVAPLLRQQQEAAPAPAVPKNLPTAPPASENKNKGSSFDPRTLGLLPGGLIGALADQMAAAPEAGAPKTAAAPAPPAEKPASPPAKPAHKSPPPSPNTKTPPAVIMSLSGDQIIIASQDREALDQMESLLRVMARQSGGLAPGRNYSIHVLKNAPAAKVAETLQQLFRPGRGGSLAGLHPVVITADERMNAILVQAGRADRATIESYLKVIDAEETPADASAAKPLTVPLHNAKAARVELMLRTVFKAQLGAKSTAAGSSAGPFSAEVTVDEVTNSLIITAPPAMAERIAAFARSLDASAGDNAAREIAIVPLKKTNAARVQKILDILLEQPSGTRTHATRTH
jgi:type II secretory pathway component GspD/PulD (secretin)